MTTTSSRYAVYHALDLLQMVFFDPAQWATDRDSHYRRVAEVEVSPEDPLNRIFRLTNHFDKKAWVANPEVVWFATHVPIRSTSVGDVIVSEQTGQEWMVLPNGFEPLSPGGPHSERKPEEEKHP
jgi:hypothetical protein